MEDQIVEDGRWLRYRGLSVSQAEVADAMRTAALVGVGEREALRAAARASLVKRSGNGVVFDRLFELYFSGLGQIFGGIEQGLIADLTDSGLLEDSDLDRVEAFLSTQMERLSPLTRAALSGDAPALARLLRGATLQLDFSTLSSSRQVGFFSRRLLAAAGGGALALDLVQLQQALVASGFRSATLEVVAERLVRVLRGLEELARDWVEIEQRARGQRSEGEGLAARSFAALNREEIARAETAVRRIAERLKVRLIQREQARLSKGSRRAPLLVRKGPAERPNVMVLGDVSDSTRHVSRMVLLFLYTLQSFFARVRGFVFVSDLGEVTSAFGREKDVARALDQALATSPVNLTGYASYGRVLRTFLREHLTAVTRRTTVILVGNGRNRYHSSHAWVLDEVKRRARRVIWICPEERWAWGSGDSEMLAYAPRVDRVAIVTQLSDLEGLADQLFPR